MQIRIGRRLGPERANSEEEWKKKLAVLTAGPGAPPDIKHRERCRRYVAREVDRCVNTLYSKRLTWCLETCFPAIAPPASIRAPHADEPGGE